MRITVGGCHGLLLKGLWSVMVILLNIFIDFCDLLFQFLWLVIIFCGIFLNYHFLLVFSSTFRASSKQQQHPLLQVAPHTCFSPAG